MANAITTNNHHAIFFENPCKILENLHQFHHLMASLAKTTCGAILIFSTNSNEFYYISL